VALFPRQIVASVTAAAVLLCGVVCACGGVDHQDHSDHLNIASPAAAAGQKPHCHGDRENDADHGGKSRGHEGGPCKDTDHSCRHCQPTVTIKSGAGGGMVDLKPLAQGFVALPLVFAAPLVHATHAVRWSAVGDLSPPVHPTLLSLRCAFTT
jgi:hypothetical protein